MSHEKNCQNCGTLIRGSINKRFCSDGCRKYYKRHGNTSLAGIKAVELPDKSGQDRTTARSGSSGIGNYAAKKGIDLLAKYVENSFVPPKPGVKNESPTPTTTNRQPLIPISAKDNMDNPMADILLSEVELPEEWQSFFGKLTYPFRMLVWGLPGSGKSTFCMKLANEIAHANRLLYIAGEEDPNSQTLLDKQRRTITMKNASNCIFIDRMPVDKNEWETVFKKTEPSQAMFCNAIFYDSVTQLGITPFYVQAAANDFNLILLTSLSHIFITHAHKDGQQYRGDGSWGHEVDVIVRVEKGVAMTEKNRFGEVGKTLKVF